MKRIVTAVVALGLWVAVGSAADGQEALPILVQSKLNTGDAGTVAPGEYEISLGLSWTEADRAWLTTGGDVNRGGRLREIGGELGVTTGLLDNLDIGLGIGYANIRDRSASPAQDAGVTDIGIGVKYMFYEWAEEALQCSAAAGFTIPIDHGGRRAALGLTQDYNSFDMALIATKDLNHCWTATADLGYSVPFGEKRADSRGVLAANAAIGWQCLPWVQPELELNYERDFLDGASDPAAWYVTGGFLISLRENLLLSIGAQQAIAGKNTDKTLTGIVTLKWVFN